MGIRGIFCFNFHGNLREICRNFHKISLKFEHFQKKGEVEKKAVEDRNEVNGQKGVYSRQNGKTTWEFNRNWIELEVVDVSCRDSQWRNQRNHTTNYLLTSKESPSTIFISLSFKLSHNFLSQNSPKVSQNFPLSSSNAHKLLSRLNSPFHLCHQATSSSPLSPNFPIFHPSGKKLGKFKENPVKRTLSVTLCKIEANSIQFLSPYSAPLLKQNPELHRLWSESQFYLFFVTSHIAFPPSCSNDLCLNFLRFCVFHVLCF
jgi:hypothetical protein